MAQQTVGQIPEFTQDEGVGVTEVKETAVVETVEEKETPSEPLTEKEPAQAEQPVPTGEAAEGDGADTRRQVQGLEEERLKLLKEIQELRGQRREIKKDDLLKPVTAEQLEGVHPDDVKVVDKILQAKGYMTKEEAQKMLYQTVKDEELAKFLEKYPEYKPENDPRDTNWGALQRELAYYRMPDDPRKVSEILERAHQAIARVYGGRSADVKKQQVVTAGKGSGGMQRPNSQKASFTPDKIELLRRGGWSDDEIKEMEASLSD